jgi:type II secretory ATPase GspE/PulE/Tfp pilus assembly ATPase PilB-like protein
MEMVPESVARESQIVPLGDDADGALQVAMSDPNDRDTIEKLRFILNKEIVPVPASPEQIQEAIDKNYGETETQSVDSRLTEFTDTAIDFTQTSAGQGDDETPVVRLVQLMIKEAISLRASAILIKPKSDRTVVTYEIDGKKVERDSPPRRLHAAIVKRVKFLASLDMNGPPREQQGRFSMVVAGTSYEIAVRVTPGAHGETVVLKFVAAQPLDDLAAFRQRAARILEASSGAGTEDPLRRLGVLTEQLTALLEDLKSVGARAGDYKQVTALFGKIEKLLSGKSPSASALRKVLSESEAALREFSNRP